MSNKGVELTRDELIANLKPKGKASLANAGQFNVSLDEIDSFGNKKSLMDMVGNINSYNKMIKEGITLINAPLTAAVPFTRENLYLFCAYTGSGKSTVAANISYPLWKQEKKVLVISNEETESDVLFRIACIEKGYSFNDYKKGRMPQEQQLEVIALFPGIAKYVKVLDVNFKDGLTTKIEGIKNALESVKNHDYSCAMIDYYQLIQSSATDSSKTKYDVLNELRIWLGKYIKSSNIPIVMFVQLYSQGKRGGVKDIDARIKECTAIVEPATVIIEVVPDWQTKTSDFIIHKDRFGYAGNKITCAFENGRFVKVTEEEVLQRKLEGSRDVASKNLDALTGAKSVELK